MDSHIHYYAVFVHKTLANQWCVIARIQEISVWTLANPQLYGVLLCHMKCFTCLYSIYGQQLS